MPSWSTSVRIGCLALLVLLELSVYTRAAGEGALEAVEIAEGIFVAEGEIATVNSDNGGHIANIGFVVGDQAVAVVDTGGSRRTGEKLLATIRAVTPLPIRFVINTHMHPDHILGNSAFVAEGALFVGHANLATALGARAQTYLSANEMLIGQAGFAGTTIIAPTMAVKETTALDLGGRTILVKALPTAHTDNDVIVIDVKTRTAWLGDVLFVDHLPVIDGSLTGWLNALEVIKGEEFALVVPGHGPVSHDWPGAAAAQITYLNDLERQVRAYLDEGRTLNAALDAIRAVNATSWQLVDEFHRRNISAAFAELEWQ